MFGRKKNQRHHAIFVVPNVQSDSATILEAMFHVPKNKKKDESQKGCNNLKNPAYDSSNKVDRKLIMKCYSKRKKTFKRYTAFQNYYDKVF
jgi:hypothetical protein